MQSNMRRHIRKVHESEGSSRQVGSSDEEGVDESEICARPSGRDASPIVEAVRGFYEYLALLIHYYPQTYESNSTIGPDIMELPQIPPGENETTPPQHTQTTLPNQPREERQ